MPKAEEYIKGDHYLFKNRVISVEEVTNEKFLLKFEKQFDMKAGHVVAVSVNDQIEPRIYSLCSGDKDKNMQILFDLKQDGKLTPFLSKLNPGDSLYVSKPYGSFMPDSEASMIWIATGTGIAPFYSMLRSGFNPQKMIHGARFGGHFYFEREFKTALNDSYIRCNSGDDGKGDFFGRVTKYLEEKEQLPSDYKYYLCGRALMVVEVRDLLISKGVRFENIISEIFF